MAVGHGCTADRAHTPVKKDATRSTAAEGFSLSRLTLGRLKMPYADLTLGQAQLAVIMTQPAIIRLCVIISKLVHVIAVAQRVAVLPSQVPTN